MKLKLELNKTEIEALIALSQQAADAASVMIKAGKSGGKMEEGFKIEFGCSVISDLIKLAGGK
jgi:hypothetical protein